MTNERIVVFLFLKDYAENGDDRFFLYEEKEGKIKEVSAAELINFQGVLLCHDYWLIAPAIFDAVKSLPKTVIDVQEFSVSISGFREDRLERDRKGIAKILAATLEDGTVPKTYSEMFNKEKEFEEDGYAAFAACLLEHWKQLIIQAHDAGELERQNAIEIPIFNLLYKHIVSGIGIQVDVLREHKQDISYQYYSALKKFSDKHDFPLEVPSDNAIAKRLMPLGFDFSEVSVDAVLRFLRTPDSFGEDVLRLRKLDASRGILDALPVSRKKARPIIDIFGSVTSRIYFKNPVLQNLAKQYRNIIVPDADLALSYVDYDQFEVGIMAAISEDPNMLRLYSSSDIYSTLSADIFGTENDRKIAKRLFLSYAYGMKPKFLVQAAVEHGADRSRVKTFFSQFTVFEEWKKSVESRFEREGKVGTDVGNFQRRAGSEQLTEREKRACVNQVVQGTASLIFKKALLKLGNEPIRILVPMHDAVLVEHRRDYVPQRLVEIFGEVMTAHFGGRITGKASLEPFYRAVA